MRLDATPTRDATRSRQTARLTAGPCDELLPLLRHPDANVRGWAGAHALQFAADQGQHALEDLVAQELAIVGFDAEQTLAVWREGKLSFP